MKPPILLLLFAVLLMDVEYPRACLIRLSAFGQALIDPRRDEFNRDGLSQYVFQKPVKMNSLTRYAVLLPFLYLSGLRTRCDVDLICGKLALLELSAARLS
jgi:hypothetical protein